MTVWLTGTSNATNHVWGQQQITLNRSDKWGLVLRVTDASDCFLCSNYKKEKKDGILLLTGTDKELKPEKGKVKHKEKHKHKHK